MLLVYSPIQTPRLNYILKFLFKQIMGCDYNVTSNLTEFSEFTGPRLNYSDNKSHGGLWISATDLLFSNEIKQFELEITETSWGTIFFAKTENTEIPFDLLASSFYLVSRYEEYLPSTLDSHGRFLYSSSIAFKADFLQKPIINIWAKKITELLVSYFPDISFNNNKYNFISTIDIDNAFAYKGKGFFRTIGGYMLSLINGKTEEFKERRKVLKEEVKDPYDSYDYIKEIHLSNNINPKVFILSGKYSKYDKNVKLTNILFSQKIKELSDNCEIGIHPSYLSNTNETLLFEKLELEKIVGKTISISRQHFLMLRFPDTYSKLIENEIKVDFSMGYSQIVGYRASTCSPFYFFDLIKNKETELLIYSFAWMDRTLRQHLNLSTIEAIDLININIEEIKELSGTFVSLWHNESLGDTDYWKGWKDVFAKMINKARES